MRHLSASNLDYLTARLHARRSRMAEAERLDGLSRLRTLDALARTVFPGTELPSAAAFQRHSVQMLIRELSDMRTPLSHASARLLDWLLVRFQLENVKVLLRACVAMLPLRDVQQHLTELPTDLALNNEALATADSPMAFARLLPRGVLRQGMKRVLAAGQEASQLFFLEAALDRAYLQELLIRTASLSGEDTQVVEVLAQQEADVFHLMLVVRGRFHYGLPRERLLRLHVGGTRIPRARFAAMLEDSELTIAMRRALGRALDALPLERGASGTVDPARFAALAWNRYLRLANRAFRSSPIGFGAVVGYVGLRRMETANLITLSEGIRFGLSSETIDGRMIPRTDVGVAHV